MRLTFRLAHLPSGDDLPVRSESLHADAEGGFYRIANAPFFVSDLSFGDLIEITALDQSEIVEWRHVKRSDRSTVWLMVVGDFDISPTIRALKSLGCRVEGFPAYSLYAVDAPVSIPAASLDEVVGALTEDQANVAYPSWRHDDEVV